jgi:DNA-binding LacI/PurR family transcriptional regulator
MANFISRAKRPPNRFCLELRYRGLSNTEVATLIGVNRTTVSRWCRKQRKWNLRQRAQLSYHLSVPQLVLDQWWNEERNDDSVRAAARYGLKVRKQRANWTPDDGRPSSDSTLSAGTRPPATRTIASSGVR